MSLWKSLFGSAKADAAASAGPIREEDYEGYRIEAVPFQEGGQWQVAGTISKEIGGERKVHRFIRADRLAGADDAAEMAIRKGKQIVDQVGERMFDNGP
jgi:hypothetical protein